MKAKQIHCRTRKSEVLRVGSGSITLHIKGIIVAKVKTSRFIGV
jgi:hypothetical protein